jgi:hypothetical protein
MVSDRTLRPVRLAAKDREFEQILYHAAKVLSMPAQMQSRRAMSAAPPKRDRQSRLLRSVAAAQI